MTLIEADDLPDIEKGGFADEDTIADLFNESESGLRGHEIQMYSEGTIRFICYHKHSGVEFFSDEISLRELFDAMHFEHVIAELEHQVLLYKARSVLRRIRKG